MLIIFEGPDGAGKTTLIKRLRDRLDAPFAVHAHKRYPGERRIAHHYAASVYEALNGAPVMMDRSWLSEPIYGQAVRGDVSRLREWEVRALEKAAGEAGALVVLCLPPYGACREAWASRLGEEYVKKEDALRAVYDLYAAAQAHWQLRVVHYDRTAAGEGAALEAAMGLIARLAGARLSPPETEEAAAAREVRQEEARRSEEAARRAAEEAARRAAEEAARSSATDASDEDDAQAGTRAMRDENKHVDEELPGGVHTSTGGGEEEDEEGVTDEELLRIAQREAEARGDRGNRKKGGRR